jgi:hypothetical protein
MSWPVAHIGDREAGTGFWWRNLRDRDHLKDFSVDGRILLRCIFRKRDVKAWTGSTCFRIRRGGGYL